MRTYIAFFMMFSRESSHGCSLNRQEGVRTVASCPRGPRAGKSGRPPPCLAPVQAHKGLAAQTTEHADYCRSDRCNGCAMTQLSKITVGIWRAGNPHTCMPCPPRFKVEDNRLIH